jgi:hypothetical protein
MKKHLLLFTLFFFTAYFVNGQELINGGNMEDSTLWNYYWGSNASDSGTFLFNYTDEIPSEGDGGCYRVTSGGQSASFLWQNVTVTANHNYLMTGAFKNISEDSIANTWVEFILTRTMPTGGEVSKGSGEFMYTLNTWHGPDTLNFDGTFEDDFIVDGSPSNVFWMPDTVTKNDWYVVVKAGCWNTEGDPNPTFDFLFDELSLVDKGVNTTFNIDQVVEGSITDGDDYTCTLDITWDADSVYMFFDVVDDSIYTGESNAWDNDNIEIYFDMDNSKTPTWPRNDGWPASSYDTNDYQLRLVPGGTWEEYNSINGVNYAMDTTLEGYTFKVNIPWDSLLVGFDAVENALIGFDVLASDNDSDDGRNQVTWNSQTAMPWNDVSLFGTLKLSSEMALVAIPDLEKPSDPTNLSVNATDTTLSWDASTDNIAVHTYIIYDGNSSVDTVYGKNTGNTYKFTDLEAGNHTLGVTAVDNSGNKSGKATVDITIEATGLDRNYKSFTKIYPNPSNGVFNIISENNTDIHLAVYNIAGKEVVNEVFNQQYTLNLTASGVYYVKLNNGKRVETVKLIVR